MRSKVDSSSRPRLTALRLPCDRTRVHAVYRALPTPAQLPAVGGGCSCWLRACCEPLLAWHALPPLGQAGTGAPRVTLPPALCRPLASCSLPPLARFHCPRPQPFSLLAPSPLVQRTLHLLPYLGSPPFLPPSPCRAPLAALTSVPLGASGRSPLLRIDLIWC